MPRRLRSTSPLLIMEHHQVKIDKLSRILNDPAEPLQSQVAPNTWIRWLAPVVNRNL